MRRIPVAIITLVGSLVVAACSGRDTTAPRRISPDQASAATVPPPSTICDINAVKSVSKAYFTSNQDPALGWVTDFASAYRSGGAVAATPIGWQILAQVAAERLTASTADATTGATFVIDLLRCMADLSTNPATVPLGIPSDFVSNAALVLNSGIWEVRTGGTLGGPALGKVKSAGAIDFAAPHWGVETQTSSTNWPGSITYAVYGYPKKLGSPLLNSPTNINTNDDLLGTYIAANVAPFNAFELGSLPYRQSLQNGLRVGVCYSANSTGGDGSVNRLVHGSNQILANSSPNQMCSASLQATAAAPSPWYAATLNRALALFTPGVAYAQGEDFIGGLPSGWSPFNPGTLSASNIVVTITQQPSNAFADSTNTLVVKATYSNVPVPQVKIDSITVANNSGSPAGAVITRSNTPQFTGDDGTATITFAVGKAGGYLVTVYGSLDGGSIPPVTSTQFQVQNK